MMKRVLFVLLGIALPWSAPAEEAIRPKIACDAPVFDFGETTESETVEHDFLIRNEGKLSLEIRNVRVTCGCTAAKPSEDLIPPGGSAVIHATFNPKGRNGNQSKSITLETNDPQNPNYTLQIKGRIIQLLRSMPQALVYTPQQGEDSAKPRTLKISSDKQDFQITKIETDSPAAVTVSRAGEEAAAREHELTVEVDLSKFSGRFNTEIRIWTDIQNVHPLKIPVVGYVPVSE